MRRIFLLGVCCIAGCSTDPRAQQKSADFVVEVAGQERYVIRLVTTKQIDAARSILSGASPQRIVSGKLADGGDGYNQDPVSSKKWTWHVIPETISFVEVAMELCDGLPTHVEGNKEHWIKDVKHYCPWKSRIIKELL